MMAFTAVTKMSLQAQFDDLCRYISVLAPGCAKEFKVFAEDMKKLHLRNKELIAANKKLVQKINELETEKLGFETKFKHARNLLISGDEKFRKLEQEKISLESQIGLIKDLLAGENGLDNLTKEKIVQLSAAYSQQAEFASRLSTIEESGTLLCSSECDESDSLECSSKSKESSEANVGENTLKENKRCLSDENIAYRCRSEPSLISPEMPVPRQVIRSDSENINVRKNSFVRNRSSLPNSHCSTDNKLGRNHAFVPKTFIRSEGCHPCGKMIKFCKQGFKCPDCRLSCHMECKKNCILTCIPVAVPQSGGSMGTIAEYTTSVSPMIPSIIFHCVNEIESRGLLDMGLYRVTGREREIREIKDAFLKTKSVPLLNDKDVHAICGTVKEFLRSLKESLITKTAWQSFMEAANYGEETTKLKLLFDLVGRLPQPNRDTLAFLILHLKRIAAAPMCKMPISNLAKVLGPTIIGYSSDEQDINLLVENKQQNEVMEMLLKVPSVMWQNLLNKSSIYDTKTPECLPAPSKLSRLGPISFSPNSETLQPAVKSDHYLKAEGKNRRKIYFSSPRIQ